MNDRRKADAEVYHKLATAARARMESARQLEWRISFSVWTLFVAGIALVLTGKAGSPSLGLTITGTVLAGVLAFLYLWLWLPYIGDSLRRDNMNSYWWETHLEKALHTRRPPHLRPREHWATAYDAAPDHESGIQSNPKREIRKDWHTMQWMQT